MDEERAFLAMKDTRNLGHLRSHEDCYRIHPGFLSTDAADTLFTTLLETIPWQHETIRMFGRTIEMQRSVAFFATTPLSYAYSGTRHHSLPIAEPLNDILKMISTRTGEGYNSILANLYPDGASGLGWHRDNESALGPDDRIQIAALSLGATRKFEIRDHSTQEKRSFWLTSGCLLEMQAGFQTRWQHRVPRMPRVEAPRISLSFRTLDTNTPP